MPTFSSGIVDLREQVREWVSQAVSQAMAEGALALDELPNIVIDRARDPSHGDFACPVALGLAKTLRAKPRDIATTITGFLQDNPLLERTEIAGPGFINLYLSPAAHHALVDTVRVQRDGFGRSQLGQGKRVQVEFVSSNPTGPLHVGHGRGAAYGAAVADILAAVGYDVEREYYVNDAGRQMNILTVSVWLRYLELCGETIPFPANGYQGDYIFDIAADIHREQGDVYQHTASAMLDGLPADEADGGDKEIYIDALSERAKSLLGVDAFRAIFDVTLASSAAISKRIWQVLVSFSKTGSPSCRWWKAARLKLLSNVFAKRAISTRTVEPFGSGPRILVTKKTASWSVIME